MKHGLTADVGQSVVENVRRALPCGQIGAQGQVGKFFQSQLPQTFQFSEVFLKIRAPLLRRLTKARNADKILRSRTRAGAPPRPAAPR